MYFATKPPRHTQNGLFLEQDNNLELAGYLWKLLLLHWLLEESKPELCRWLRSDHRTYERRSLSKLLSQGEKQTPAPSLHAEFISSEEPFPSNTNTCKAVPAEA